MTTDTKIVTVATNPKDVFHSGQLTTLKNSETLKGSASGETIGIDNISPVEHIMDVKVRSKNLLSEDIFAPKNWRLVSNGTRYVYKLPTINGDCVFSYALNGTRVPGYHAIHRVPKGMDYEQAGAEGVRTSMGFLTHETNTTVVTTSMVLPKGYDYYYWICYASLIDKDLASFEYMQLEVGTTPTSYTPFISDLTTVNVKTGGKNILSYPYSHGTGAINGITWTVNSDGSIIANGTATAQSYFYLRTNISLQAGKVFVQGLGDSYSKGINMRVNNIRYVYADDKTVNIPDGYTDTIYLFVKSGATVDNVLIKPPFACYNDDDIVKEYEVNSDGTVEGVTNLYPDTTLLTDTNGAIIDCNYYKDIDKTFDELLTNVALSGGEG